MTHFYDKSTKEFLESKQLDKAFGTSLPSTTIKEPLAKKDFFAICFNEEKNEWEYIEDNRNKIIYSSADKSETKIDYLGAIKDGFTFNRPKEFDKWNGTTWEADIDSIKTSKLLKINNDCNTAIISGFKCSALGSEYFYYSTLEEQSSLVSIITLGIDSNFKAQKITSLNDVERKEERKQYPHTLEQLKQVLGTGAVYIKAQIDKKDLLETRINNATTVEELELIEW
jgi:hypothetical protein